MVESLLEPCVERSVAETALKEPNPVAYPSKKKKSANLNWEIMDALLLKVSRAREGIKIHCDLCSETLLTPIAPLELFNLISQLLTFVLRMADQDPARIPRRLEIRTGREGPDGTAYLRIRICMELEELDSNEKDSMQKECKVCREMEQAIHTFKQALQTFGATLKGPLLYPEQRNEWAWDVTFPTSPTGHDLMLFEI